MSNYLVTGTNPDDPPEYDDDDLEQWGADPDGDSDDEDDEMEREDYYPSLD